jgi:hypothetical protein
MARFTTAQPLVTYMPAPVPTSMVSACARTRSKRLYQWPLPRDPCGSPAPSTWHIGQVLTLLLGHLYGNFWPYAIHCKAYGFRLPRAVRVRASPP